jgi:hypothetical protein
MPRQTPATTRSGLYAYRAAVLAMASVACGGRIELPGSEGSDGSVVDAVANEGGADAFNDNDGSPVYGDELNLSPDVAVDAGPFDASLIPDAADARDDEHVVTIPYGVPPGP